MKKRNLIVGLATLTFAVFGLISCEEDKMEISASISDYSPEVLQGDSTSVTIAINGGKPPFAFRYSYFDGNQVVFRNIIDIQERSYTFKTLPTSDITYNAESVASYGLVGGASGSAAIKVAPVTYNFSESIPASKSAYMQKSVNALSYNTLLQVRSIAGNFERRTFFEFDISQFAEIKDKSNYNLKFWLISTHSTGLNKEGTMDVKAMLGPLNEGMTWSTQPETLDLTPLFTQNFISTSSMEQIEFEGNINPIVYSAIDNNVSKITFVIRELINNVGNTGLYYLGSDTYTEEAQRPFIDVYFREKKIN